MAREPKILSVLIAESVRQEVNGLQSIIGVFSGGINVPSLPLVLPQLAFRIEFRSEEDMDTTADFYLLTPSGSRLFAQSVNYPVKKRVNLFTLAIAPFGLSEKGRYEVHFGLGGKPKQVSEFEIIEVPQTAA
jgi:hypothetical protein